MQRRMSVQLANPGDDRRHVRGADREVGDTHLFLAWTIRLAISSAVPMARYGVAAASSTLKPSTRSTGSLNARSRPSVISTTWTKALNSGGSPRSAAASAMTAQLVLEVIETEPVLVSVTVGHGSTQPLHADDVGMTRQCRALATNQDRRPGLGQRIEVDAACWVLLSGVAGTQTQLEPPTAEFVDRGRLPGHVHWMAHVVVEHERAQGYALRGRGE